MTDSCWPGPPLLRLAFPEQEGRHHRHTIQEAAYTSAGAARWPAPIGLDLLCQNWRSQNTRVGTIDLKYRIAGLFLNTLTVIRAAWDPVLPENHQYLNIGEDLFMELSPQYLERYSNAHGLINYKDTKTKCRHLKKLTCKGTLRQVFIRVHIPEIQSVILVSRPSFVNYCPFNLLSGSPPPPFPVSTYSKYRQWIAGRRRGCWRPYSARVLHSVSDQIHNLRVLYRNARPP